jgi:hypothetical protein
MLIGWIGRTQNGAHLETWHPTARLCSKHAAEMTPDLFFGEENGLQIVNTIRVGLGGSPVLRETIEIVTEPAPRLRPRRQT